MRFLIIPFIVFLLSFLVLRTSGVWSTKKNWKRIGLETGVAFAASVLMVVIISFIVIIFN